MGGCASRHLIAQSVADSPPRTSQQKEQRHPFSSHEVETPDASCATSSADEQKDGLDGRTKHHTSSYSYAEIMPTKEKPSKDNKIQAYYPVASSWKTREISPTENLTREDAEQMPIIPDKQPSTSSVSRKTQELIFMKDTTAAMTQLEGMQTDGLVHADNESQPNKTQLCDSMSHKTEASQQHDTTTIVKNTLPKEWATNTPSSTQGMVEEEENAQFHDITTESEKGFLAERIIEDNEQPIERATTPDVHETETNQMVEKTKSFSWTEDTEESIIFSKENQNDKSFIKDSELEESADKSFVNPPPSLELEKSEEAQVSTVRNASIEFSENLQMKNSLVHREILQIDKQQLHFPLDKDTRVDKSEPCTDTKEITENAVNSSHTCETEITKWKEYQEESLTLQTTRATTEDVLPNNIRLDDKEVPEFKEKQVQSQQEQENANIEHQNDSSPSVKEGCEELDPDKSPNSTEAYLLTSRENANIAEMEIKQERFINNQESRTIGEQKNTIWTPTSEEWDEESNKTVQNKITEKQLHENSQTTDSTDATRKAHVPTSEEAKDDAKAGNRSTGVEIINESRSTGEQHTDLSKGLNEQYEESCIISNRAITDEEWKQEFKSSCDSDVTTELDVATNNEVSDAKDAELETHKVEIIHAPEGNSIGSQYAILSPDLEEQDKESCTTFEYTIKEEVLHEGFNLVEPTNAITAKGEFQSNVVKIINETQNKGIEQHTILPPTLEEQSQESCTIEKGEITEEEKKEDFEINHCTNVKTEARLATSNEASEDAEGAELGSYQAKITPEMESTSIGEQNKILSPAFEVQDEGLCTTEEHAIIEKEMHKDIITTGVTDATIEVHFLTNSEVKEDVKSGEQEIIYKTGSKVIGEQQIIFCASSTEKHEESCTISEGKITEEEQSEEFKMNGSVDVATEATSTAMNENKQDTKDAGLKNGQDQIINKPESTSTDRQHTVLSLTFEEHDEESCTTAEYMIKGEDIHKDIKMTNGTDQTTEACFPSSDKVTENEKVTEVEIKNETDSLNIGEQHSIRSSGIKEQHDESCSIYKGEPTEEERNEYFRMNCTNNATRMTCALYSNGEKDDVQYREVESHGIEIINELESRSMGENHTINLPSFKERHEETSKISERSIIEEGHSEDLKVICPIDATTDTHIATINEERNNAIGADLESIQNEIVNEPESISIGGQHTLSPAFEGENDKLCTTLEYTIKDECPHKDFKMNNSTNQRTETHVPTSYEVKEDTNIKEEKDEDFETSCTRFMKTEAHVATSDDVNKDTKVTEQVINPIKVINEQESRSTGEQNAILPAAFEEQEKESCTTAEYAIPEKDLHEDFKLNDTTDATESQIPTRDEIKRDTQPGEFKSNGAETKYETQQIGSHEQKPNLAPFLEEQHEVRDYAKIAEPEINPVDIINDPQSRTINDQYTMLSPSLEEQEKESFTTADHAIKEDLYEDVKMIDHFDGIESTGTHEEQPIMATFLKEQHEVRKDIKVAELENNQIEPLINPEKGSINVLQMALSPALRDQEKESHATAEHTIKDELHEDFKMTDHTNATIEEHVPIIEVQVDVTCELQSNVLTETQSRTIGEEHTILSPGLDKQHEESCTATARLLAEEEWDEDSETSCTSFMKTEAHVTSDAVNKDTKVAEQESDPVKIKIEQEGRSTGEQNAFLSAAFEEQAKESSTTEEYAMPEKDLHEDLKLTNATDATESQIPTRDEIKQDAQAGEFKSNGAETTYETEQIGSHEQKLILAPSLEEQHEVIKDGKIAEPESNHVDVINDP